MAVARDDLGRAARKRGIEGQVTIIRHFGIRRIGFKLSFPTYLEWTTVTDVEFNTSLFYVALTCSAGILFGSVSAIVDRATMFDLWLEWAGWGLGLWAGIFFLPLFLPSPFSHLSTTRLVEICFSPQPSSA